MTTKIPKTDSERFEATLQLLSEDFVDDLVNQWLWNTRCPFGHLRKLEEYGKWASRRMSYFHYGDYRTAQKELNRTANDLKRLIAEKFDRVPAQEKQALNDESMLWLPRSLRDSSDSSERAEYKQIQEQLNWLAEEFERTYNIIVDHARSFFAQEKSNGGVGIRIRNSTKGVMKHVIAEGPGGGIDMEGVEDITMHDVVGRSTEKIIPRPTPKWHETGLGKLLIGLIVTVLGGLALSFFA